jgi:putative oxidoreductase
LPFADGLNGRFGHDGTGGAGSGEFHIAGGLSILLGYRAKLGAWLIVLFLIPVTLMLHKFWTVQDPMMAQIQ